ncbi:hypothetical protein IKR55_02480 [bacterium]|nr:hypothetical protein [bacterium]
MFDRIKNLKIVKQLKESISPKARWQVFSAKNTLDKSTTDYLESISGVENLKSISDDLELEAMVRSQLKEEFPNIESMKSYELLVDAVMHNMRKKQLQATDDLDIK